MYVYIYIYTIYIYTIYIYSYWKPIIKVIGCHSHGYPQMPDVPSIFHILHPIHQIFWSHLLIPASTRQCPGSVPPPLPPGRRTRRLGKLVQNWRMKWWNMENGNCCWTSLENCWNQRCWTRFFFNGVEHCRLLEVLPILPGTPLRPAATALPANEDPPPHQSLPWAWKSSKIIPKKIIQKLNQKNDEFQQNHPKSAPQNII